MCPTSPPRRWDGSRAVNHRPRALHVAPDRPTRLLRAAQGGTCRLCGNRLEWYQRSDGRPIGLHPTELTTRTVPARCRWHLSRGVAQPAGDGSAWCRIPHHLICPGLDTTTLTPPLNELRRQLALRTRRLIDAGTHTPPSAQPPPQPAAAVCRPSRPIPPHRAPPVRLLPRRPAPRRHPVRGPDPHPPPLPPPRTAPHPASGGCTHPAPAAGNTFTMPTNGDGDAPPEDFPAGRSSARCRFHR
ncbi:DUF6083 domain-containing protein [Streptomyces sp. NPDC056390]|uniref:DUF6083 domain-containing protein n=1 Tax=Streptomyces sp. NPDC056390 TaxID=3345806 RepID=UPI0035E22AC3